MIKNKLSKQKPNHSPSPNLNNISNIRHYYDEGNSEDVFSNSDIPSFSSDQSTKSKKVNEQSKDKFGDETIITQPFTHEKNCVICTPKEGNSLKTSSRNNLKLSEHVKISSLTSKLTLDGISNKTCSCLTARNKSSMFGTDSHFPSTYNDINSLSEEQIQEIIRHKMKLLDKYNEKILKKKNSTEYKYIWFYFICISRIIMSKK